jgi:hypothetical protein
VRVGSGLSVQESCGPLPRRQNTSISSIGNGMMAKVAFF